MLKKIINGTLLLPDGDSFRTGQADLFIRDGKIAGIGTDLSAAGTANDVAGENRLDEPCEVIDASGQLIMPGLINMHTHAYMTSMRNYADDVDFQEWLFGRITPVEDRLPKEGAYWTSLLACMEMLRTGTTSFVDMHMFHEQSARAADAAGMRAWIGRGLVGDNLYADDNPRFREAMEEMDAWQSDRLHFILSPHAIYTCSLHMLEQVVEESERRHMLRQTHLSESLTEIENCRAQYGGRSPVEVMRDVGFLSDHTILAHCVQLDEKDVSILAESGSSVVTNPASNAKLGNGFAPVTAMRKAGINITLGTDGTASNNTLNMFREMGLLSLIHKGICQDSTAAPASFVLGCATENAAKALHAEGQIGSIREGAWADLVFVDLGAVSLFPNNNIVSSLCYSANGSEVESVMVAGEYVMKDREYTGIDTERVYYEVSRLVETYL